MMDSYMVHRSARADQAGDGVGVEPGGFTPFPRPFDQAQGGELVEPQARDPERSRRAGGRSRRWCNRLATRLEENFCEVIRK